MPPDDRAAQTPWPLWPLQLRVESSHEEGGIRDWGIATTAFTGEDGRVSKLHAVRVGAPPKFEPIPGTEFTLDADLVLLAMGFTGPVKGGLIEQLGVNLDARGNVATDANYMSSSPGVFAAGDMRRGQSLVVWAIAEGRKAAEGIDHIPEKPVKDIMILGIHASQGFKTCTCVLVKSLVLRDTTVRLWCSAVAASKPSMIDRGFPTRFASAASWPHRLAIAASIGTILPENRACSSTSSQVSRSVLRLP